MLATARTAARAAARAPPAAVAAPAPAAAAQQRRPLSLPSFLKPAGSAGAVRATTLSGSEAHCLERHGLAAGDLVWGNSVRSLGAIRGLISALQQRAGGSNTQLAQLVRRGREHAYNQMMADARTAGGEGVVGATVSVSPLSGRGLIEFVSYGSTVHRLKPQEGATAAAGAPAAGDMWATTCTGEQHFCLRDCGFKPKGVVFGNEAYSRGLKGMVMGTVRIMFTGEVPEYSAVFNQARATALTRLRERAFEQGCSMVSGVRMQAVRMRFVQEVTFVGTACTHPDLPAPRSAADVATSALPEEELWSLISCGRRPLSVVMACSIYNLGVGRALTGALQQIAGGEASRYTQLGDKAREQVAAQVREQAQKLGADEVVSVRIVMEEIQSGLVEFLAFGTAVAHDGKLAAKSRDLPSQVLMGSRRPFISHYALATGMSTQREVGGTGTDVARRQEEMQQKGSRYIVDAFAVVRMVLGWFGRLISAVFPFLGSLGRRIFGSGEAKGAA
eukprot:TRINITY_DN4354_c1_g3_i1.p2 TRINITY_DN4354_c1_g3~~TRINITY_DN4354_c1_g3_i1.p2  ORF type:complete len:503 (+),score=153.66 TRINITY_DN4354_c1_g3_i1:99-1607(+)